LTYEKAAFAAGCFWGVQDAFDEIKGVRSTLSGYAGGHAKNPTYKDVCRGNTGHAETVEVEYDPSVVPYSRLLETFWSIHNPTRLNRQGPDVGSQYRSAIFYYNAEQKKDAEDSLASMQKKYRQKIVTEIVPASAFYPAEEYHQHYHRKNPGFIGCFTGLFRRK
jgi:peptide-methionine (S)-S-oxide reductase